MNINEYTITEGAVFQGVARGVEELLKDVNNFSKPEIVVEMISQSVLDELCNVFEFSQQTVRLTGDILRKIQQLQEQDGS